MTEFSEMVLAKFHTPLGYLVNVCDELVGRHGPFHVVAYLAANAGWMDIALERQPLYRNRILCSAIRHVRTTPQGQQLTESMVR
jgi:hypothetical protein